MEIKGAQILISVHTRPLEANKQILLGLATDSPKCLTYKHFFFSFYQFFLARERPQNGSTTM